MDCPRGTSDTGRPERPGDTTRLRGSAVTVWAEGSAVTTHLEEPTDTADRRFPPGTSHLNHGMCPGCSPWTARRRTASTGIPQRRSAVICPGSNSESSSSSSWAQRHRFLGISLGKANGANADLQATNSNLDARNAFLESSNAKLQSDIDDLNAVAGDSSSTSTSQETATGVDDPWVASGRFTTGNAELDEDVKSFCDYLSDPDASASDNAYTVYLNISWYDYVEDDNQDPQGPDWAITYALQLYNEGGGNCYEFVAFCAYCLQYFGYDATAEPCLILREDGDWGNHGLVLVNADGQNYICDLSLSSNGWMLAGDAYTYEIEDIGQNA